MDLSSPAQVAIVGYLLVCLSIFFPMPIDDRDKHGNYRYRWTERFVVLFMLLLPMALSVFTIHCMTAGAEGNEMCGPWSWVNAIIVFLWSIVVFGVAALGAFTDGANTVEGFVNKSNQYN